MRGSIYDEYRETILYYREKGFNYSEIAEMLPEGYTYQGMMDYVRKHINEDPRENIVCDTCPYKIYVETYAGNMQKVCLRSWKMVTPNSKLAPRWCKERVKK